MRLTGGLSVKGAVQTAILSTPTSDPSQFQGQGNANDAKLQFPYLPQSMLLDAKGGDWAIDPIDDDPASTDVTRWRMAGYVMSSMEGIVWEELTNIASISTVKALQLASQSSISMTTVSPGGSAPSTLPTGIQSSINQYLSQGYQVYTPMQTVTIGSGSAQWTGAGYILRQHDTTHDPSGTLWWDIGFIIQDSNGSPHGGYAIGAPATVTVPTTAISNYEVGDPINTANGNVTHDETDFTIPNLGAPLGMARHYDSFNTVASGTPWSDRGMGDGWSFTYSDKLVSDTSLNNPADANDPNRSTR